MDEKKTNVLPEDSPLTDETLDKVDGGWRPPTPPKLKTPEEPDSESSDPSRRTRNFF